MNNRNQRGEILLTLLVITAIAGLGLRVSAPSIGRYIAISQQNGSIVRMDTSTGTMERCSVVGNTLTCTKIVAQQ